MKLSSIRIDSARLEGGDWVSDIPGLGDIRLKVRGLGNLDYRRLHAKLVDQVSEADRDEDGAIRPKVLDAITADLALNTLLVGWDGVEHDDSTPEVRMFEPFTPETATRYLTNPDYRAFLVGVIYAADQVAERAAAKAEVEAKN